MAGFPRVCVCARARAWYQSMLTCACNTIRHYDFKCLQMYSAGLGVRFQLLALLLTQGNLEQARKVCRSKFAKVNEGDGSSTDGLTWDLVHPYMLWSRVLVEFLQSGGETDACKTALSEALQACPAVPHLLLGCYKDPVQAPYFTLLLGERRSLGGIDQAEEYVMEFGSVVPILHPPPPLNVLDGRDGVALCPPE